MTIKLFCQKNFTGSALKARLESAIAEKNLPYKIEEINNKEEFVKEGITSVPAFKANGSIIIHRERDDIDETVNKVLFLLDGNKEHHILVPIDFTTESIHALKYAMMLATQLNRGITIAHIHEPLIDPITNSAFDIEMMERSKLHLDDILLEAGWDKFKSGRSITLDSRFEIGDPVSRIGPMLDDEKYDLIVMSSKAENTFWRRLLNSVSIKVSRKSLKPVIIVPPYAEIKFPKKMFVGADNELLYGTALDFLVDFASGNSVFLKFVHIEINNEHSEWLKGELTDKLLSYNKKLAGFEIVSLKGESEPVDELLISKSSQNDADMLVLMTHHRNLINSLGHRSISKRVLLEPNLPVMILHGEDETGLGIVDYLYSAIQEG